MNARATLTRVTKDGEPPIDLAVNLQKLIDAKTVNLGESRNTGFKACFLAGSAWLPSVYAADDKLPRSPTGAMLAPRSFVLMLADALTSDNQPEIYVKGRAMIDPDRQRVVLALARRFKQALLEGKPPAVIAAAPGEKSLGVRI
jgi:hypothetical protein